MFNNKSKNTSSNNSSVDKVTALKKGRSTDKLIDGDLSIDVGFFDNLGRYDTNQFIRWTAGIYTGSFGVVTSSYLSYSSYINNPNAFNSLSEVKYFAERSFDWLYLNAKTLVGIEEGNVSFDFKMLLGVSFFVGTALVTWLIAVQRFKGEVQSFLASSGLSQYYLKSFNKKTRTAYFKLIKGEQENFQAFMDKSETFKQMFGVGELKVSRKGKTGVTLQLLEETPRLIAKYKGKDYTMQEQEEMVADGISKSEFKIISTCKRTDFSSELVGENKSLLGVKDINGKALFAAFPQTVGMIQGHALIAGGTGSGKSFMISNWIKSVLMSDTAQFIDEIIVINMKEDSPDWEFLDGHRKVSLYTGAEEALVALKRAELKMLANNRWNTLNGQENTNFGQTIVIIDEIHKFSMFTNDTTLPKSFRQLVAKCNTIIDTLATQARSANLFVLGILQKATLDQLSGVYRSNAMNRILLRSDAISSGVVIDEEIQKENMIDSQKITSGQFIYWNMQNGIINKGFAVVSVDWDIEKANAMEDNPILIEGRKQSNELVELAKIVAKLKANKAEEDEANKEEFSKSVNSYDLLEVEKRDYWGEAEKILNGEMVMEEPVVEKKKPVKKSNKKSFLKEEEKEYEAKVTVKKPKVIKEKASEEELEEFLNASEEVMELEDKLEDFEEIEKLAEKSVVEMKEIEDNPKEKLKDKVSPEEIQKLEEAIKEIKKEDITIDI